MKERLSRGFTLVEMLAGTVVVLLLSGLVAAGVRMGMTQWDQQRFYSQAEVLNGTIQSAMSSAIRYMKYTKSSDNKYFLSLNTNKIASDDDAADSKTYDEIIVDKDESSGNRLVLWLQNSVTGDKVPLLNTGVYGTLAVPKTIEINGRTESNPHFEDGCSFERLRDTWKEYDPESNSSMPCTISGTLRICNNDNTLYRDFDFSFTSVYLQDGVEASTPPEDTEVGQDPVVLSYATRTGGQVQLTSGGAASDTAWEQILPKGTPGGATAVPRAGYEFKEWLDADNNRVSTNATFVPPRPDTGLYTDATYTADFIESEDVTITYAAGENGQVQLITSGGAGGSVSEDVAPATGNPDGAKAVANTGYKFSRWVDAQGNTVSASEAFIPSRPSSGAFGAVTYTALFEEDNPVTIAYQAGAHGKVQLGPDGDASDSVSEQVAPISGKPSGAKAVADAGYRLAGWRDESGKTVSTSETFVPEKTGGVYVGATYRAVFVEANPVTITYKAGDHGQVKLVSGGSASDSVSELVRPATGKSGGAEPVADDGYKFDKWVDDKGNTVSEDAKFAPERPSSGAYVDATYTAQFVEADEVTITYAAGENGTVQLVAGGDASSSVTEKVKPVSGDPKGARAIKAPGYRFKEWQKDSAEVSEDETFVPSRNDKGIYEAATYTAVFEENDVTISYEAKVQNADGTLAEGNGGGAVKLGDQTAVQTCEETIKAANGSASEATATPDNGYEFVGWQRKDSSIAPTTDNPFTPAKNGEGVYEAATYYALFKEKSNVTISYVAKVRSADGSLTDGGGTVSPASESVAPVTGNPSGSTATANAGYHFAEWQKDGNKVSGEARLDKSVLYANKTDGLYADATYTAVFEEDDDVTITYKAGEHGKVQLVSGGDASGSVSEDAKPVSGNPSGAKAVADDGYKFAGWQDEGGNPVATTDETLVPTKPASGVFEATTYTATFVEADDVTITYVAGEHGQVRLVSGGAADDSVSEGVKPVSGDPKGARAVAATGYKFVRWVNAQGNTVSDSEAFTPQKSDKGLYEAATYTAVFEENVVQITYKADGNGTVSLGDGGAVGKQVDEAINAALGTPKGARATADAGYRFVGWKAEGGSDYLTKDASYTPAKSGGVYATATYVAVFEEDEAKITYKATAGGSVHVVGSGDTSETVKPTTTEPKGAEAVASNGYDFVGWRLKDSGAAPAGGTTFKPSPNDKGVYESATYEAVFKEKADVTISYVAKVRSADGSLTDGGGTVSPTSESVAPVTGNPSGSTATAASGYKFVEWRDAQGNKVSGDAALPKSVLDDHKVDGLYASTTYTAVFEAGTVTITYKVEGGGTVALNEDDAVAKQEVREVLQMTDNPIGAIAAPSAGCTFVGWKNDSGVVVSTDQRLVPSQIGSDATYTAVFHEGSAVKITYKAGSNGKVGLAGNTANQSSVSENVLPLSGTPRGATAKANSGYQFAGWYRVTSTTSTLVVKPEDGPNIAPEKSGQVYEEAVYEARFSKSLEWVSIKLDYLIDDVETPVDKRFTDCAKIQVQSGAGYPTGNIMNDYVTPYLEEHGEDLRFAGFFYDGEGYGIDTLPPAVPNGSTVTVILRTKGASGKPTGSVKKAESVYSSVLNRKVAGGLLGDAYTFYNWSSSSSDEGPVFASVDINIIFLQYHKTPVAWYDGHYYKTIDPKTGADTYFDSRNNGRVAAGHFTDGATHKYGNVSVIWKRVS